MTDTRPGPVEAATQDLMAWLAKTGQPVRQAPPSDTGDGLALWALELRPQPPGRKIGRASGGGRW